VDGTAQIFENKLNESKLYSGINRDKTEIREYLLSLVAESFVF
jgi:hypothetical protein